MVSVASFESATLLKPDGVARPMLVVSTASTLIAPLSRLTPAIFALDVIWSPSVPNGEATCEVVIAPTSMMPGTETFATPLELVASNAVPPMFEAPERSLLTVLPIRFAWVPPDVREVGPDRLLAADTGVIAPARARSAASRAMVAAARVRRIGLQGLGGSEAGAAPRN